MLLVYCKRSYLEACPEANESGTKAINECFRVQSQWLIERVLWLFMGLLGCFIAVMNSKK
jgi:hypothetical protein